MCVVNEERHSILLSFSISIDKTSRRETFSFEAKGSKEMALKRNFISFYSEFRFCFLFWPALMENIFISWMLQTFVTFQLKIFLFYVQPLQAQPYQFHFCLFKSKKENERKFIKFYNCWSLNEDEKRSTMTNFCWRKEHEESKNFLIPSCLLPGVWEIPEKIQFERIQLSMQCGSETESMMIRKYPFI